MKKEVLFLLCAVTALSVFAEDRLYINNFTITPGETKQVEIMLDNTTTFTALQADINLPTGLNIEQEDGDYLFELTERKGRDHTLSSTMLANGAIRILIASQNLKTFSGNSGALVTFNIIADETFSGPKNIELKNVIASEVNQTQHTLPNTYCIVTVEGEEPPVGLIEKFYINDFSISPGATRQVEIMLDNESALTALQADIYLPTGLNIEQEDDEYFFELTERNGSDHTISSSRLANGAIRIFITSQNLKTFSGNNGALVTFNIIADESFTGPKYIELKNVIASEVDQTQHTLPNTSCIVTELVVDCDIMFKGIAYNINSDNETLTITYTDKSNTYANNYPGLVTANIPMTVTHDGVTYTVVAIAEHAFRNCKTLTQVSIPTTIISVGTYAFGGCEALDSITVESGNSVYDSRENCNAIIETTNNTLISGCKTTVIPNSVTKIGTFAFYEHHGVETIEIPSSVTVIGRSAFNHILGLKTIVVPNSVVTLEPYVFSQCYGLEEATIGSGVTSIGMGLMYGCSAVTSLTSYIKDPTAVEMGANVFKNMDYENCVLHVPAGTVNLYKATDQWKDFLNIVASGVLGDVDGDGIVTAADVTVLYNYLLNNDSSALVNGDQDGDGHITAGDVTVIYNILLGNH